MRVRLDLAYLGAGFEGWQRQNSARLPAPRTVQGELEGALGKIFGRPVGVEGAGRTDSGVHANGQVAHFDVPHGVAEIPVEGLRRGLNRALAPDVRVTDAVVVEDSFHARFSAVGKIYRYRLRLDDFLHPHTGLVEALARTRLDVPAMQDAAGRLVGRRDFAPFSLTGSEPTTTVRLLSALTVEQAGTLVVITAIGEGFLRGMVRRLAGTLREVGRGRTNPADVLSSPGPTLEARGLTLERVLYPPERLPGSA
ncbi:MAG: tRNA pseudouridine(38-40) synthase TruA [Thermoanaerobaculia bacterium]